MKTIEHCPLCDSANIVATDVHRSFFLLNRKECVEVAYSACLDCQFIFQSEYIGDAELADYYENSPCLRRKEITDIEAVVFNKQSDFINRDQQLFGKKVLEIGADTGQFLMHLKHSFNCDVYFDEMSVSAKEIMNSREGFIDYALLKDKPKLDVVVARHVLEHIFDVNGFIRYLFSILSDQGRVFVEVPDWSFLDDKNDPYMFEHLNQFNSYNLGLLFKRCGFVVEQIEMDIVEGSRSTPNRVLRVLARKSGVAALGDHRLLENIAAHNRLQKQVANKLNTFLQRHHGKSIGISPASHYTFELFLNSDLKDQQVLCLFDNDKKKEGESFMGKQIVASKRVDEYQPELILVLTIGGYMNEIRHFFEQASPESDVVTLEDILYQEE